MSDQDFRKISEKTGCVRRAWAHRASNARANIPTAFGAAAEVPPCDVVHSFCPLSVVTYNKILKSNDDGKVKLFRTICFPLPEL